MLFWSHLNLSDHSEQALNLEHGLSSFNPVRNVIFSRSRSRLPVGLHTPHLNYRQALSSIDPKRLLYLAVPADAFETFFQLQFTQEALQIYHINIIVYEPDSEVIVLWNAR